MTSQRADLQNCAEQAKRGWIFPISVAFINRLDTQITVYHWSSKFGSVWDFYSFCHSKILMFCFLWHIIMQMFREIIWRVSHILTKITWQRSWDFSLKSHTSNRFEKIFHLTDGDTWNLRYFFQKSLQYLNTGRCSVVRLNQMTTHHWQFFANHFIKSIFTGSLTQSPFYMWVQLCCSWTIIFYQYFSSTLDVFRFFELQ